MMNMSYCEGSLSLKRKQSKCLWFAAIIKNITLYKLYHSNNQNLTQQIS